MMSIHNNDYPIEVKSSVVEIRVNRFSENQTFWRLSIAVPLKMYTSQYTVSLADQNPNNLLKLVEKWPMADRPFS